MKTVLHVLPLFFNVKIWNYNYSEGQKETSPFQTDLQYKIQIVKMNHI